MGHPQGHRSGPGSHLHLRAFSHQRLRFQWTSKRNYPRVFQQYGFSQGCSKTALAVTKTPLTNLLSPYFGVRPKRAIFVVGSAFGCSTGFQPEPNQRVVPNALRLAQGIRLRVRLRREDDKWGAPQWEVAGHPTQRLQAPTQQRVPETLGGFNEPASTLGWGGSLGEALVGSLTFGMPSNPGIVEATIESPGPNRSRFWPLQQPRHVNTQSLLASYCL